MNATLAEPKTNIENSNLLEMANSYYDRITLGIWLGATDSPNEDDWRWISTNTALQYTNWSPGQPDDHIGRENCLMLYKPQKWKWNDARCNAKLKFICQKYNAGL